MQAMKIYYVPGVLTLLLIWGFVFNENKEAGDGLNRANDTIRKAGNPELLFTLPQKYNTPDGMASAPDKSIILSVPNLAGNSYPGVLLKIEQDTFSFFADLPVHPDTRHACPMDLAFGPDGNLYYADNQYENNKNHKSRLMRVVMKNNKPVKVETAADGFALSNAVVWKADTIYVTDSQWDLPDNDKGSAVFRFSLDELKKGVVHLKPRTMDPHLFAAFTTHVNETGVDNGADGLDYDSKGNFYTGSFGDGTLYRIPAGKKSGLRQPEVVKVRGQILSVDGLIVDRKTDRIYLCDSRANAIKMVTPDGTVSVIAQNGDTHGEEGLLDQPAEVLLKGDTLYVANFDKPEKNFVNTEADSLHTVSIIKINR